MNPVVTTNQKPTIDTQKLKRKEHKHTTKENHQITKEEMKRRYTDGQQMHEKMLNIPNHEENANQNQNEIDRKSVV